MADVIYLTDRRPPQPDYPEQIRHLLGRYGNPALTEAVVRLIFDNVHPFDFVVELTAALESDPRLLPRP